MIYTTNENWGNCVCCDQYQDLRFGICESCCTDTVMFDPKKKEVILDDGARLDVADKLARRESPE